LYITKLWVSGLKNLLNKIIFRCNGGAPWDAWQYMKNKGVVSGSNFEQKTGCKPYSINPETDGPVPTPQCVSKCTNSRWSIPYKNDKKFGNYLYHS